VVNEKLEWTAAENSRERIKGFSSFKVMMDESIIYSILIISKMGSTQLKNSHTVKIDTNSLNITHSRLMTSIETEKLKGQGKDKLKLDPFKRLIGWELELEGVTVSSPTSTMLTS
jgi:hypothetical protein